MPMTRLLEEPWEFLKSQFPMVLIPSIVTLIVIFNAIWVYVLFGEVKSIPLLAIVPELFKDSFVFLGFSFCLFLSLIPVLFAVRSKHWLLVKMAHLFADFARHYAAVVLSVGYCTALLGMAGAWLGYVNIDLAWALFIMMIGFTVLFVGSMPNAAQTQEMIDAAAKNIVHKRLQPSYEKCPWCFRLIALGLILIILSLPGIVSLVFEKHVAITTKISMQDYEIIAKRFSKEDVCALGEVSGTGEMEDSDVLTVLGQMVVREIKGCLKLPNE